MQSWLQSAPIRVRLLQGLMYIFGIPIIQTKSILEQLRDWITAGQQLGAMPPQRILAEVMAGVISAALRPRVASAPRSTDDGES